METSKDDWLARLTKLTDWADSFDVLSSRNARTASGAGGGDKAAAGVAEDLFHADAFYAGADPGNGDVHAHRGNDEGVSNARMAWEDDYCGPSFLS